MEIKIGKAKKPEKAASKPSIYDLKAGTVFEYCGDDYVVLGFLSIQGECKYLRTKHYQGGTSDMFAKELTADFYCRFECKNLLWLENVKVKDALAHIKVEYYE